MMIVYELKFKLLTKGPDGRIKAADTYTVVKRSRNAEEMWNFVTSFEVPIEYWDKKAFRTCSELRAMVEPIEIENPTEGENIPLIKEQMALLSELQKQIYRDQDQREIIK